MQSIKKRGSTTLTTASLLSHQELEWHSRLFLLLAFAKAHAQWMLANLRMPLVCVNDHLLSPY